MPLVTVVIYLIIVGVLLWLVNNYIPMDYKIKQIINILVVVVVIIWLLQVLGVMGPLNRIRVG
jgi:undecaprenyl pyrophosphate phosphatase UppP